MTGMDSLAASTKAKIDARLAEVENELLSETAIDWAKLKPELTSQEEYDALMQAVEQARRNNESVGQLRSRLQDLGEAGKNFAETVLIKAL